MQFALFLLNETNKNQVNAIFGVEIRVKSLQDALLHAIKEEYVEAVELLLQWEEQNHVPGDPYSWESVEPSAATFTPDITPLILAAHRNHYEILKILLDRGATLPVPHDVKCGCDECVRSSLEDSLRHSQARINAYRALTAPSLIALSSADPLLTAFQLSWELGRLSRMETEFRVEYKALRQQCQEFATALLDHTRTSKELEIMLNYNPWEIDCWEPGERQTLGRLKLAIKYKQKKVKYDFKQKPPLGSSLKGGDRCVGVGPPAPFVPIWGKVKEMDARLVTAGVEFQTYRRVEISPGNNELLLRGDLFRYNLKPA
ncbi:Transient receptor potential protein [Eumeta japonica]|uniref:Transient receptor potential protein n=1 Tax=Eumeta variegata TaxID=151549 RepID=A0A4C1TV76_EUMVA|nr:Transient receptor potential protein [Eumeta japonica]